MRTPLSVLAFVSLFASGLEAQTALKAVRVDGFYRRPVDIQAPPGDHERLFIVSQYGQIHLVKNGKLQSRLFLDLGLIVRCCGEGGLLGLAFHPNYRQNGYFYVNYTQRAFPSGDTMIVRYKRSSNPDVADPSSRTVVMGPISQPFGNHNGGGLAFSPNDGYLYIGLGDGGSGGDPGCRAQSGGTFMGKMLRIDVNRTGGGYSVPASNPFTKDPNIRNEIWHLGWRNPWRYSFDRKTGDMYVGDVGQGAREEISFQSGKSTGGENYGWKFMEGNNCYGTRNCSKIIPCRSPLLTDPIHDYDRNAGRSVTGGYVYRGCAIPDLQGTYFFGDYRTRNLWSFRYDGKSVTDFKQRNNELGIFPAVSSFGEDAAGELYIADLGGSVYKIVPNAAPPVRDLGFGKRGGNGQIPKFDACGLLTSGNSAKLMLSRAPKGTVAILTVSTQRNPTNIFGGTLLPVPIQLLLNFVTDGNGQVQFTIPGGGGPSTLYAQYVLLDRGATFGFGFSNALQIDFQR